MDDNTIVFTPHYNGRATVSLVLWPISAIAFVYLAYDAIRSGAYYSEGLLALIFALATIGPPFIYFRQLRFGEMLVVKRYLLPDVVIAYADILSFQYFSLRAANARISLNTLTPKSFAELDQIIDRLIGAGTLKIKKKR